MPGIIKALAKNRLFFGLVVMVTWALSRMTFDVFMPKGAESVILPLILYLSALVFSELTLDDSYFLIAGFKRSSVVLVRYVVILIFYVFAAILTTILYYVRYTTVEYGLMFYLLILIYLTFFLIKSCAFLPVKIVSKALGKTYLSSVLASMLLTVLMLSTITLAFGKATIDIAIITLIISLIIAAIALPLSMFYAIKYFDRKDF